MMRSDTRLHVGLGIAAWLFLVVAGFASWHGVERVPGAVGTAVTQVTLTSGPRVAVYVHPHCFCTRAVLPELMRAFASAPAGTEIRILFVCPREVPAGWERTPSWDIAAAHDAARDDGGAMAMADGAETSGFIVARDAAGRVVFRGGLAQTGSSVNPGLDAVRDILAGRTPALAATPVFGCPLLTPD